MCPFTRVIGSHERKKLLTDFGMKSLLETLMANKQIDTDLVFKKDIKIGMLPETMIAEYMDLFYLKSFAFYDKTNKVERTQMIKEESSYLRQQTFHIHFRKNFYYTQAMAQLTGKSLNYQ